MDKRTNLHLLLFLVDFGTPGKSNYFGLVPSEANYVAPGKKPLSSMSPMMVFRNNDSGATDGKKLALVVGGSGGPKIISAVLQVILSVCLVGMSLFDAVAKPRIHEQLLYHDAAITTTEKSQVNGGLWINVSNRTRQALLRRGHDTLVDIDYAGTVQAVSIDLETNKLSAMSDIRKGGTPAGY